MNIPQKKNVYFPIDLSHFQDTYIHTVNFVHYISNYISSGWNLPLPKIIFSDSFYSNKSFKCSCFVNIINVHL